MRYLIVCCFGVLFLAGCGEEKSPFEMVTLVDIKETPMSDENINGSNEEGNQLTEGAILIYKTNQRRYGKMEIMEYGYNLRVRWVTYGKKEGIHSEGENFLIKGTSTPDMDEGRLTRNRKEAEFHWRQLTKVKRVLAPWNGSKWAVWEN